MEKTIRVHFGYLTGAILGFVTAFFTGSGNVQEHISFAGAANEISFCFLALMLGALCLFSSFSNPSKSK